MILITGGLGFIGLNTARALLEAGESCVLTRYRVSREPDFVRDALGERAFVEQLDVTDGAALLELGKRYPIDGIVHLAGAAIGALDLLDELRTNLDGLLGVLRAARDGRVPRVVVASTIAVYQGARDVPWREDALLPMTGTYPIESVKKTFEVLGSLVASQTGVEVVSLRVAGIWGPFGRPDSRFLVAPRLVHAAVRGEPVRFDPARYALDGLDMCYARDCGRAIALAATTPVLRHKVYNVGSGRFARNEEVAAAVRAVVPDADIELTGGRDPHAPAGEPYLDITRLREDTGYRPAYDTGAAVRDYVDWLRAGNGR